MPALYRRGRVWWCTFRGYDGRRRQKSTRCRDKRLAARIASHMENQHALAAAGLIDAADIQLAQRGLVGVEVVRAEFLKTVQATETRKDVERILVKFQEQSGIRVINVWGTTAVVAKAYEFLQSVQETGVQARRVNDHLKALRMFGAYACDCGYARVNQLEKLKRYSVKADQSVVAHGAFTPAEFRLLADGANGLYYAFRAWTGIRGEEAGRIVRGDLDFEDPARISIRKEVAKNGLACTLPLAPGLASRLFGELGMRHSAALLFPEIPVRKETRLAWLRRDLVAAGLDAGRFNNRSMRLTFCTWLEAAGVEMGLRQKLRRDRGRGSERLTVWTYSDESQVGRPVFDAIVATERWYEQELQEERRA